MQVAPVAPEGVRYIPMRPLHPHLFFRIAGTCLCSVVAAFPQSPRTPPELMQQVFNALERNDKQALKALTVTKSDFKKFIWPNLSRTVAKVGTTAETFYLMSVKQSDFGLAATLNEFGGRKWAVVQVAPVTAERQPIHRRRFRAFSGPAITIRDSNGQERTVHIVGGIVELGGVYKVSTYSLGPDQHQ
jgi:hypothetical protein